jgi:hypothetical protein
MAANSPPILPGSSAGAAFDSAYKANIGRKWIYEGSDWRMVKATGALTSMSNAVVTSAEAAGVPSYSCSTTTTAGDRAFVGVCATGQVDLAAGEYFMVQCSGVALMIADAGIATDVALATSATAKRVGVTGATLLAVIGYAKVAAGGGGTVFPVQLVSR